MSNTYQLDEDKICPQCKERQPFSARFCGTCRFQFEPVSGPPTEAMPALPGPPEIPVNHPESRPAGDQLIRAAKPGRLDGLADRARSLVATFVVVWILNVPLAILLGLAGLVSGAFVGAFGGVWFLDDVPIIGDYTTDVFHLKLGVVAGGLVGAAVGAIAGALTGLLAPILLLTGGDPIDIMVVLLGQIFLGILVAVAYTAYAVSFESTRLRMQGARRPSRRERALLEPLIESCAASLHLSSRPLLLMDDDRTPNARSAVRHIVINVGLLEVFCYEPRPIEGVICHELVHWNSGDPIATRFLDGVALPFHVAYSVLSAVPRIVNHTFMRVLVWLFFWPILVAVKFVVIPVRASDGRRNEYRADRGALLAGRSEGLRQVLAHLRQSFDGSRHGWDDAICATHPPNELRLEGLELLGMTYVLPDRDADGPGGHRARSAGRGVDRDW